MQYRLIRERDGLIKKASKVLWISWNNDGRFNSSHDEPAIGRSLVLEPGISYTWLTTSITEMLPSENDNEINFKTKNSIYKLVKFQGDEKNNREEN